MDQWIKKVPSSVLVTLIVVIGGIVMTAIVGFVVLSLSGQNTDNFTRFINTMANLAGLPFLGLTTIASVVAAKSSSKTEERTNGPLQASIKQTVQDSIKENMPS